MLKGCRHYWGDPKEESSNMHLSGEETVGGILFPIQWIIAQTLYLFRFCH